MPDDPTRSSFDRIIGALLRPDVQSAERLSKARDAIHRASTEFRRWADGEGDALHRAAEEAAKADDEAHMLPKEVAEPIFTFTSQLEQAIRAPAAGTSARRAEASRITTAANSVSRELATREAQARAISPIRLAAGSIVLAVGGLIALWFAFGHPPLLFGCDVPGICGPSQPSAPVTAGPTPGATTVNNPTPTAEIPTPTTSPSATPTNTATSPPPPPSLTPTPTTGPTPTPSPQLLCAFPPFAPWINEERITSATITPTFGPCETMMISGRSVDTPIGHCDHGTQAVCVLVLFYPGVTTIPVTGLTPTSWKGTIDQSPDYAIRDKLNDTILGWFSSANCYPSGSCQSAYVYLLSSSNAVCKQYLFTPSSTPPPPTEGQCWSIKPPISGLPQSPEDAAALFGGEPGRWERVDEHTPSAWHLLAGVVVRVSVPAGWRIDYVRADGAKLSCVLGTGRFGPLTDDVLEATLYYVPASQTC